MSKTNEELATEIVVALLGNEKTSSYVAAAPEAMARNIASMWSHIHQTILDRQVNARRR